jgi:hypothetical protein
MNHKLQTRIATLRAKQQTILALASRPGTSTMAFRDCIRRASDIDQRIKAMHRGAK